MPHSSPTGAIKLSQDFSTLVNNPSGSDVYFEVGGGSGNSRDQPIVRMYAHSVILRCRSRYFAAMFEDECDWKERSSGVIKKPNVSPVVFQTVLWYIYTGAVDFVDQAKLLDVIASAEELELEELSRACQDKVMEILHKVILDDDEEQESEGVADKSEPTTVAAKDENMNRRQGKVSIPITIAIRTLLIPALVLAYQHILAEFFQQLLAFTFNNIRTILASTDTRAAFLDTIPLQILKQILASNELSIPEHEIWDLALDWACHQTKILKPAVESQLRFDMAEGDNNENEEEEEEEMSPQTVPNNVVGSDAQQFVEVDQPLVTERQLQALKATLKPIIPTIRFTLMEPEKYSRIVEALTFFLPARRSVELQRFFSPSDKSISILPEVPRAMEKNGTGQEDFSTKIIDRESWTLLKSWIYEANVIEGCQVPEDIRFSLLFRASDHGFDASVFHQRCDNQGPTIVLVKSIEGRLFGGFNFASWTTDERYSYSRSNFLFALKDDHDRSEPAIFKIDLPSRAENAAFNHPGDGPTFGNFQHDLYIANHANRQISSSHMPNTYHGPGATNTALAGHKQFKVVDYEVFAVSGSERIRTIGRR